jgi:Tol biopolymer transport system component
MLNLLFSLLVFASTNCFAAPADKSLMTFMRETAKEKQIMVAKPDGSNLTAITRGRLWHLYPAFSPSAEEITYVVGESEQNLHLVTQNLSSGSIEQWTIDNQKGLNLHPSYSGNGEWLVFSAANSNGKNQIRYFNLAQARSNSAQIMIDTEEGPRKLLNPQIETIESEYAAFFPNFSSDAGTIIYQQNYSADKKNIVQYDVKTKKTIDLTPKNSLSMSPSLSPDDRFITYTSKIEGNWDIYVQERLTGKEFRVTQNPSQDFAPTFNSSNDIIFSSNRNGNFNLHKISFYSWFNHISDESVIISGQFDDYSPSFSGDKSFTQLRLAPFSSPSRSSFGAIRVGSKVFMAGGHQGHEHTYPEESFMNQLEYYDLITKEWKKAAPRPHKAHGFALANNGKYIYAFGGFAYEEKNSPKWKSLDVIDRYDIENDKWETIGKMPRRRSSNVVVTLGSKVYLIGGWDSTPKKPGDFEGVFHKEIDIFDFETERMVEAHFSMPDPLRRAFTAVSYQGKIILVGGIGVGSSHFDLLTNVTEIDPTSGLSRELKPLPFATFAPAAGILDNELFVFGGMYKMNEQEYDYVSHIYSFDLSLNKWSHSGRFLSENKGFSQVVEIDSKTLGILGGHQYKNDDDTPVSTFEIFQRK